ncbi:12446_t:CDS:2 [Rhizophagus irregularis]|nr:12446_t:CDS:2 [Rhizophagus irregularis]
METTLHDRENFTKADIKNNKKKSCQWNDDNIKLLLSFLIERKEEVNQLSTKRGGSGNTKAKLWQDASNIFLDSHCQYSAEQCAVKWKNIKKKYKDDMDHNKKSGNDLIEVKYKAEVEEILDGNRPSLTPKLLESSLDQNDEVIIEKEALFNEITGRSKRKNRSDESIQEDEPRKANRSERRQQEFSLLISALNSTNRNMMFSQNDVPFYYQSSSFNTMQFMDTSYTDTPQINRTHTPQINRTHTSQIDRTRTSQIDRTRTPQIDRTRTPQIDPTLQFE